MKLKKISKKFVAGALVTLLSFSLMACGGNTEKSDGEKEGEAGGVSGIINVISREDGSGTRGAFTEIVGLVEETADGEKDMTSEEASVQNSTNAVMTAVSKDPAAIGYISLGSLNDTVKAVKVEGVEPTAETIRSGDYKIARPFNLVYKADLSEEGKDFLDFLASDEAQQIATDEGYVGHLEGKKYEPKNISGHMTISGSTSVAPLMEKLVAAYQEHNPEFKIDIQATGSSAGIKDAQSGAAEIGMASRELKDNETGVEKTVLAMDGIAVIVNTEDTVDDLTMDQIKNIFNGTITDWSELN